jgi:hypothetical protein
MPQNWQKTKEAQMSIKFEIINGTLCRMVEPEPLTEESKFPCVVRLIQDDSPMGKYNALKGATMLGMVWLATGQNCYTVHINGMLHDRIFCYEIIGYPVAAGSAEWALWQRQNKRSVITDTGVVMRYHYDDETCNALLRVYPTGWQLYEPKPLPMASTHDGLGDKFLRDCLKPNEHPIITGCNRLDYVPVEGIRIPKEPKPEPEPQPSKEPIANCDNCKHTCTNSNIDHCHMYEPKPKPVKEQFEVGDCRIEFVKQELHNLLDKI